MSPKLLETPHGIITFPTFMPVTTFGGKYPLDDLIRPYLRRFTDCVMVSYYYAKQMKPTERPNFPLFIDSGGFASLFEGSQCVDEGDYAIINTKDGNVIAPPDLLAFQEKHADIGATLDFIIPPCIGEQEAHQRQELTIKNALWALNKRRNTDLRLFASVQAWDAFSAKRIMSQLANHPFDGFALGGMVPKIQNPDLIVEIVHAIREIDSNRPLHVFGIGQPKLVNRLFQEGVDSTDSSSTLKATANRQYLLPDSLEWIPATTLTNPESKCSCAGCHILSSEYFGLRGETNHLALALHNLLAVNNALL